MCFLYGNPGDVRFTSRAKETMRIPAADDWTFAVQSDDGYMVKISGDGYFTSFSGGHTRDKAICHTVTMPSAGNYEVEILHSNIGGACVPRVFCGEGAILRVPAFTIQARRRSDGTNQDGNPWQVAVNEGCGSQRFRSTV